jgi:hypothetical protein
MKNPRFEITGCATDVFTLEQISAAVKKAGAILVNARNAFGWSNQPKVCTFEAPNRKEANHICDEARETLKSVRAGDFPSIIAHMYK